MQNCLFMSCSAQTNHNSYPHTHTTKNCHIRLFSSHSGPKLFLHKRSDASSLHPIPSERKAKALLHCSFHTVHKQPQTPYPSTQGNCNVCTVLPYCGTKVFRLQEKRHHWSKLYRPKENNCNALLCTSFAHASVFAFIPNSLLSSL